MFDFIKKRYLLGGLLLSLLLFILMGSEYEFLFYLNTFSWISFSALLYGFVKQKSNRLFTVNTLILVTILYGCVFMYLYKYASFYYDKDFFVFSKMDAFAYQSIGKYLSTVSFAKEWQYLQIYWKYDDYGAFVMSSILYRIFDSPFTHAVFYILIGARTTLSIFNIGKNIMPTRYAFMAAFTFAICSFTITFQATYLKETFMLFLVIFCYEHYYAYAKTKAFRSIFYIGLCIATLIVFRPVLIVFVSSSFAVSAFFSSRFSYRRLFVLMTFIGTLLFFNSFVTSQSEKYYTSNSGDFETSKQEMIRGGIGFTYAVNALAGMIGPLPAIVTSTKPFVTLFSPGLLFRVMTALAFWLGIIYMVRKKVVLLYPIACYIIFEAGSLVGILEALELRKSLIHFPFIFLIAFWFMAYYDSGKLKSKEKRKIKYLNYVYLLCIIFVLYFWNSRSM